MNDAKYIGLDVRQATVSATVLDSAGKLVMESIVETKAATILQFMHGLRGDLQVTFEEGTCAAWLHGKRCEFVSLYCWFILEFLWPREIHRIWFVHPG